MWKFIRMFSALVVLASTAGAQQFWDKKPYEKWSRDECRRLLEESPWVQKYAISAPVFAARGGRAGVQADRTGTDVTAIGGAGEQEITYTAQLRTALPMRRAVVQQALLAAAKQGASVEQMQAMRTRAEQFVNSPTNDIVIVHIIYGSNNVNDDRALARYWQEQTVEKVKDIFSLIGANGRRVAPLRYEALPGGGREFAVTFPRLADGQALVTAQDKTLAFEFTHPAIGTDKATKVLVQYQVKDMVRGEEVVY